MNDWDQLRFAQTLETYRSTLGQTGQIVLGLTLGVVTVIGFAVDRESWGLFALGLVFEVAILLQVTWFAKTATELLSAAGMLEEQACDDDVVTQKHANFIGSGDLNTRSRMPGLMSLVLVFHVAATLLLALGLGWSFGGFS